MNSNDINRSKVTDNTKTQETLTPENDYVADVEKNKNADLNNDHMYTELLKDDATEGNQEVAGIAISNELEHRE